MDDEQERIWAMQHGDILACPFCGEPGGTLEKSDLPAPVGWRIYCDNCEGQTGWHHTDFEAVMAWNASRAELAELKDELHRECQRADHLSSQVASCRREHIDALGRETHLQNALAADLAVACKWSAWWKHVARLYHRLWRDAQGVAMAQADLAGELGAELAALRAAIPPDAAGLSRRLAAWTRATLCEYCEDIEADDCGGPGAAAHCHIIAARADSWAARLDALAGEGE